MSLAVDISERKCLLNEGTEEGHAANSFVKCRLGSGFLLGEWFLEIVGICEWIRSGNKK